MYQVLIAEDEALIRTGIVSSIPWENYNITVSADCADGLSAWEQYRRLSPDIVITDLRMPGMTGQELIARIRSVDSRCRIIVITCLEDFDVIHSIIDKDLTAYLVKASISGADILSAVLRARDYLDTHGSIKPTQNIESLMREFLIEKSVNISVFDRNIHALLPDFRDFGSILLMDRLTTEQNRKLQMLTAVLGDSYTLDYYDRTLMLLSASYDSAILASCLDALRGEGIRCVCRSMSSSPNTIHDSLIKANSVFSSVFFYPAAFYDLTGSPKTRPQSERDVLSDICTHPVVRGLVRCGNTMLQTSLSVLQSSFGINEYVFRNAMADIVSILSMHFPIAREDVLSPENSASSAMRCVLSALPEYEHSDVYSETIDKAITFTAKGYASATIKLTDLASHCGFSASYFALLFRKSTGLNFTDYLSILRIDAACRLLDETDWPISVISDRCGFSSTSYFTRYFSQHLNSSPKEWRKERRL